MEENVAFGPQMNGVPQTERRSRVAHDLDMVGLTKFAGFYPRELSGGMKQRIAIAQMLACGPSVFLMDEPFGALDSLSREVLQDQLLQLWERDRKTVLFVTHSIDEAVLLSDRIVVMSPLPGRVKEVVRSICRGRGRRPARCRSSDNCAITSGRRFARKPWRL